MEVRQLRPGRLFLREGPSLKIRVKSEHPSQILDVTPKAEAAEIKRSYRRLALELHPDKSSDPQAPQKSDPEKREAYDYYLLHPERFLAMYYGLQAVYPAPTNPFVVLLLILFVGHLGQLLFVGNFSLCHSFTVCQEQLHRDGYKRDMFLAHLDRKQADCGSQDSYEGYLFGQLQKVVDRNQALNKVEKEGQKSRP
eukprot:GHVN01059499.1.p1 GENE.GHVN01059499.1~~GHVN01059499.1.p1  ORF type:complete len:196 (+),score=7.48 GHVN01059499.1:112-699(+)